MGGRIGDGRSGVKDVERKTGVTRRTTENLGGSGHGRTSGVGRKEGG